MENSELFLKTSSRKVFENLKESDYRILQAIAKNGFLNLKEIGEKTSKYIYTYHSFDRWGVKARFTESNQSIGLITNEYLYKTEINKKESKYCLTLKGLLAVLAKVDLENIFLVKRYQEFLKTLTNDKKIIQWAMDFIKTEIAMILYYNLGRGLNLTKFKSFQYYWQEFKQYNENTAQIFFLNSFSLMPEYHREVYDKIKKEYLKLFFVLDGCTTPLSWLDIDDLTYEKKEENQILREVIDLWYLFIDRFMISEEHSGQDWKRTDLSPYYDIEFWIEEKKEPSKEAYKVLKKNKFV